MGKVNILWKVYFCALIVVSFVYLKDRIAGAAGFNVVSFAIDIVPLVALFGFSFRQKLLGQNFWKIAFVFCGMRAGFGLFIGAMSLGGVMSGEAGSLVRMIIFFMMLVLLCPIYVAMYLYAFGQDNVWNKTPLRKDQMPV